MIFEAHQKSVFCINILTNYIFNYKKNKNRSSFFVFFLREERCAKKMVERKCKSEYA